MTEAWVCRDKFCVVMITGVLKFLLVSLTVDGVWVFGWLCVGFGGMGCGFGVNPTLGFASLFFSGRVVVFF